MDIFDRIFQGMLIGILLCTSILVGSVYQSYFENVDRFTGVGFPWE